MVLDAKMRFGREVKITMFEVINMESEVSGYDLSNVEVQLTRHNWVLDHGRYGGCG